MFEVDSDWEGATDESKKLILSVFGDKLSANKNQKKSDASNEKTSEPINRKKRKRGKKKKTKNGTVTNYTDNSIEHKNDSKSFSHKKQKQEESCTSKLLNASKENTIAATTSTNTPTTNIVPVNSLQKRLLLSLESSRFRYINEQMYTKHSTEAAKMFEDDPKSFEVYHNGYQAQIKKWDVNPLQIILTWIKKRSSKLVIADFGCGEAWIAQKVKNEVHSFDLVALNQHVTVADISKVPLEDESVDIVILCLALMGTNLNEIIFEANRVLKMKGMLKVAEVASRFQGVNSFIKAMKKFGFVVLKRNLNHTHFYLFDFQKRDQAKESVLDNSYPGLQLKPCLYKKR